MLIEEPNAMANDMVHMLVGAASGGVNRRIKQGVYEIAHFGSTAYLPGYEHWVDGLPVSGYGVCDSVDQLLKKCPELEADPDRQFVVTVHTIDKATQPQEGGWRWHKWGEYIGDQRPTTEYIAHEPVIERVLVYHIYEKLTGDKAPSINDIAIQVAARVWCDSEMQHCVMDQEASYAISRVVARVLRANQHRKKPAHGT